MNQQQQKNNAMVMLFAVTYMVSYITRINYGAVIAEIERDTQLARSLLSMAVTGSFFTYGVGQVISGFLGDRISPKRLVAGGLLLTAVMNLLIPLCDGAYQMTAVWCVNGFAQSLLWPPMVRMLSARLSGDAYAKGTTRVVFASSVGTVFVYLAAPLLISLGGWRSVFFFTGGSALVMLLVWLKFAPDVRGEKSAARASAAQDKAAASAGNRMLFTPVMLCVLCAIVMQGTLRDGVTTWMPTYIVDTYHMSSAAGILSGVVMPIFAMLSVQVTSALYSRRFTNPVLCGGVLFAVGALCAVGVSLFTGRSAALSVLFSALLTGCMHGVNLALVCMTPAFFARYGNVATASGVINACTYIGSALSTYGIAFLSERMGWGMTVAAWVAVAVLGCALCLCSARAFARHYSRENDAEKENAQ